MRVGVHINRFDHPRGGGALHAELAAAGAAAEAAGVSRLSVMDHYFQMEFNGGAEAPMLEAYTTLAYLAAHTSTVRLGALVTGVTYRHPGLLAKVATTLDVLSGGRATLGIGAAWYDREHHGLGVPYPPLAERFERLEETLRLVARYADACNLFATSPEEVAHKLDVLRGHCDEADRDYDDIRRTVTYSGAAATEGDLDAFIRDIEPYTRLGIDTVIISPHLGPTSQWMETFAAQAVRRLSELG
ncbi:Monooxygenase [Streptomyces graminofaciens]|uniref:Monooxygenase n=1 Tax=Streptomyces graminofaciens TaxID=68212 RepID=A0ABN5VWK2_9ACTN|nr:LLM class flavin-dependent oxidoreductase [Streptomyces graminofaciens]BBC37690.1 Monooxygenase [Streptomyces graminofaciens]